MKKNNSLAEWLDLLLKQPSKPAHLTYPKREAAAQLLGLDDFSSFVIVVSGTNGKGSVVTLLERLCVLSGISVGAITSPHLNHFNERIRINEQPVSDELICAAFYAIYKTLGDLSLGYFAYAMFAGYLILKNQSPDVILVEVGLGGRLDSSNLIKNNMTILTSIGLDHCEFLGDTREKIAKEKSALIKENTMVVCGDPNCPSVIPEAVKAKRATLYQLNDDYSFETNDGCWSMKTNRLSFNDLPIPKIMQQNAATAIQAFILLSHALKFALRSDVVKKALLTVYLPGRLDVKHHKCTVLLDVAHNPQSINQLVRCAKPFAHKARHVIAVCAMSPNKDISTCIRSISPLIDEWHIAPTHQATAHSISLLKSMFLRLGISQYSCYSDGLKAYKSAQKVSDEADLIIVFGSFLIVGPVLKAINLEK